MKLNVFFKNHQKRGFVSNAKKGEMKKMGPQITLITLIFLFFIIRVNLRNLRTKNFKRR